MEQKLCYSENFIYFDDIGLFYGKDTKKLDFFTPNSNEILW